MNAPPTKSKRRTLPPAAEAAVTGWKAWLAFNVTELWIALVGAVAVLVGLYTN
jgi:hypothetical protein